MAGKVFDLAEPNPNVALEQIRQAVVSAIADLAATFERDDGQDDAIDLLILDSLSEGPI